MNSIDVRITAPAGAIDGMEADGVRRFLGIPYAQAPVGPLRFAPPQPLPPFAEPFAADRHGPTPQRVPLFETTTIPEPSIPGEHTLNSDVFAPADAIAAPVLFWIHGGGYIAGSAASPWYDGSAFARDGVVVVNASYRLGVDGFGILPGTVPNRGLLDLVAALEWVRDNIGAFGGDPRRVTIAGQSAGGGAVLALLSSPRARGLFRAAISVSGVDISLDSDGVRDATVEVAGLLGVEPTVEGFGPTDDGAPMRAILALREKSEDAAPISFGPVHGDDVLPDPVSAGLARRGTEVPLLLGATADEFDGGPTPENPERPDPRGAQVQELKRRGERVTDQLFRAPVPRIAAARSRAGAHTWTYSFEWPSPIMQGATHCIDVPFLFGTLDAVGVTAALGEAPPHSLAEAMHGDVLALVRGVDPAWPPATGDIGDPGRLYDAEGEAKVAHGLYDTVVPRPSRAAEGDRAGS
jgi:para-nitrobenzyl esterase